MTVLTKSELYFAWGRMSLRDVQNRTVKSDNWGHDGRGEKTLNYVNIDKLEEGENQKILKKWHFQAPVNGWMEGKKERLAASSQTLRTIMPTALKKVVCFLPCSQYHSQPRLSNLLPSRPVTASPCNQISQTQCIRVIETGKIMIKPEAAGLWVIR